MKEEWTSVIGYEGLYEVSSCGQIKSLRKGALLTPHKINGYYVIRLCKNGKMDVLQYDLNGNLLNVFSSITEASKITGCRITAIQQVCCGHTYTSNGYIWRYKDEADTVMNMYSSFRNESTSMALRRRQH